jgi:hypothetical protein
MYQFDFNKYRQESMKVNPMPTVVQELERVTKKLQETKNKLRVYNSISRKPKNK